MNFMRFWRRPTTVFGSVPASSIQLSRGRGRAIHNTVDDIEPRLTYDSREDGLPLTTAASRSGWLCADIKGEEAMVAQNANARASSSQDKIASLYAKALGRSWKDFVVPAPEAQKMVGEVRESLELWASEDTPPDLQKRYKQALVDTERCHALASELLVSADKFSTLPSYPDDDLLAIARKSAELNFAVSSSPRETRAELPSVKALLDTFIPDLAEFNLDSKALIEKLARATQNRLRVQMSTYESVTALTIFCRGMLYLAVIDSLGSEPGRKAGTENVREKLKALAVHFTTIIVAPLEGVMLAKEFAELTDALFKKRANYDTQKRNKAQAVETLQAATSFIDAYGLALATWSHWVNELSAVAKDQARLYAEAFPPTLVPRR
jgi:hypothetical protein